MHITHPIINIRGETALTHSRKVYECTVLVVFYIPTFMEIFAPQVRCFFIICMAFTSNQVHSVIWNNSPDPLTFSAATITNNASIHVNYVPSLVLVPHPHSTPEFSTLLSFSETPPPMIEIKFLILETPPISIYYVCPCQA